MTALPSMRTVLVLALGLAASMAQATPLDPAWILKAIARPVPSTTPFVELRTSPLLSGPILTTGQYRRPAASVLVREVSSPQPETATLRHDAIEITRAGKTRRINTSRSPGLARMQSSLAAMLSGNLEELERHYTVSASGTRQAWILHMTPTDKELEKLVSAIELIGRGSDLRCILNHTPNGSVQYTFLAGAAIAAHKASSNKALLCTSP